MKDWNAQKTALAERLADGRSYALGKTIEVMDLPNFLEAGIRSGDRVCLEGDNQKQADVLAAALANVDPAKVHDLHMVQSGVVLPEHLDVFDKGIACKLDYSYSGPQAARIARMLVGGKIELGAVHTYLELFARYFIDLTPNVALIAAVSADKDGNLYTGPNTEDTPTVVEATAFKSGIVVAQVNEIVDKVPRVDIPGDQVHFVVEAKRPFYVEPLFTRDPASLNEIHTLMAMMAIKGIYAEYGVRRLNHGIGFPTAAIELLLPTYGERLGLKGKIATHWALNPHPTLIPAIESGWVEQIHCFGHEVGTLRAAWPRRLIIAGYSVGEVAAWSVAGLIDARMILDLVAQRANAMDVPSRPGDGLLFVRGLSYGAIEDLCNHHDAAIAIVNPGDAYVLGGAGEALDVIADVAKKMGAARVVRLAVNVASHTPRLAAASSEFRKILDQTSTKPSPDSNVRLLSGIDGSPVVKISAGLNKLAEQISHTVQWAHCLEGCVEAGASVFFELGPGRALNEMAAGAYPEIPARSLEDFRTLQGARAWLRRVIN
jgi:hypothetical protein